MVSRPVAYSSTMTALGGGLSRENPSKGNAGVTFEALKFWILVLSPGFLAVGGKVLSGETGRARGTSENTGLMGAWADSPPISPRGAEGFCVAEASS